MHIFNIHVILQNHTRPSGKPGSFSVVRSDEVKGRLWFLQTRPRRPQCIPLVLIIYLKWDFLYIYMCAMPIPMLISPNIIWERGMGQDGVMIKIGLCSYLWGVVDFWHRGSWCHFHDDSRGSWLPIWMFLKTTTGLKAWEWFAGLELGWRVGT